MTDAKGTPVQLSPANDAGTRADTLPVELPVELRPIGPFDLDGAAALHAACFADAWSVAAIAAVLATPGSFGILSIVDGLPAGLLLARSAADEAEILSIGVVPAWRRRGLAREMLSRAVAEAAESGARRLFLEVAADNPAARGLYLREGFVQVGRRAGYYRRGAGHPGPGVVDALILARPLGGGTPDPAAGMS